jgi:hypothetical protein
MRRIAWPAVIVSLAPSLALAAESGSKPTTSATNDKDKGPTVVKLTVRPAKAPAAALKVQLLPAFLEQTPGNAAPLYYRASLNTTSLSNEAAEKIVKWLETPPRDLPREDVKRLLAQFSPAIEEAQLAARRERCDWEIPLRSVDPAQLRLAECMEARRLAQLLALKARLEIAEGKTREALETLKTGFQLGQNMGRMPVLISGLVGIAASQMMTAQIEELIQTPKAPNLYWALALLPRPFVDLAPAMKTEMAFPYLLFPVLREAETASRSADDWQRELRQIVRRIPQLAGESDSPSVAHLKDELKLWTVGVSRFPLARAHLLAKGYTPERVEKIPMPQAVLIYTADTYDELMSGTFKWFFIPYSQAVAGLARSETQLEAALRDGREIVPLASLLLPAVHSAFLAMNRLDRRLAELQTIEAIRIYAAEHAGRLPSDLDEFKTAPVPLDPITGRPFVYSVENRTVILDATAGVPATHRRRYEITFVPE